MRVVTTAKKLSHKGTIKKVKEQEAQIYEVMGEEFWSSADIFDYENVRCALRDLIKFIDTSNKDIYYTDFLDEIIGVEKHDAEYEINDLKDYKKKVSFYLKQSKDDFVILIYKLRHKQELTKNDIEHLEDVL